MLTNIKHALVAEKWVIWKNIDLPAVKRQTGFQHSPVVKKQTEPAVKKQTGFGADKNQAWLL